MIIAAGALLATGILIGYLLGDKYGANGQIVNKVVKKDMKRARLLFS